MDPKNSIGNDGYQASELFQAQSHLYRIMYGFLNPMSVKWAVDLGIPDIIHNHGQPITLPDLVSGLEIPQSKAACVRRLMRLLAHIDIFQVIKLVDDGNDTESNEAYALTPASHLLVSSTNHCLSSMVQLLNTPTLVGSYHQLGKWTSGDDLTIVEIALGPGGYWEFIHQNPTHLKTYNEAMESDCKSVLEGLDSLVDVGGGTGNMAKIICEALPELKYIVLDLPQVVTGLTGS